MKRRSFLTCASLTVPAMTIRPWPVKTGYFLTNQMIKRNIPNTEEKLPIIGLGTWIQFDVSNNAPEMDQLRIVLKAMLEQGGTVIDSSPMYGRSEAVVGALTQESKMADDFFYATKVWTTGREAGIRQMNESMLRMQRSSMDLLQIHNLLDWRTHLKTLKQWKASGRIRYIGITHYTDQLHEKLSKIIQDEPDIDFVQCNYSIHNRHADLQLLKTAQDHGVAVLINGPFDSGALFGKTKGKTLPDWAGDFDINSWAQFFLKYIASHPAVTCVIPGTSDPKHLVDNMMAGYGKMPDEHTRIKMVRHFNAL